MRKRIFILMLCFLTSTIFTNEKKLEFLVGGEFSIQELNNNQFPYFIPFEIQPSARLRILLSKQFAVDTTIGVGLYMFQFALLPDSFKFGIAPTLLFPISKNSNFEVGISADYRLLDLYNSGGPNQIFAVRPRLGLSFAHIGPTKEKLYFYYEPSLFVITNWNKARINNNMLTLFVSNISVWIKI